MEVNTRSDNYGVGKEHGTVFVSSYGRHGYSRIPQFITGHQFFITTKGFIEIGGKKGVLDIIRWDEMKGVSNKNGHFVIKTNIKGTVEYVTTRSAIGKNDENFKNMPDDFAEELSACWDLYSTYHNQYKDEKRIILDNILILRAGKRRFDESKVIVEAGLIVLRDNLLKDKEGKKLIDVAEKMFKDGELDEDDIVKKPYQIVKKIKQILKQQEAENKDEETTSPSKAFREGYRYNVSPGNGEEITSKPKWGPPKKRSPWNEEGQEY